MSYISSFKAKTLKYLRNILDSDYLRKTDKWQKESLLNKAKTDPDFNEFLIKHQKEVLCLYRHMLKEIPKLEKNHFRRICLKERIIFNFKEASIETNPHIMLSLKNDCYIIIEKINSGIYPPFPHYRAVI